MTASLPTAAPGRAPRSTRVDTGEGPWQLAFIRGEVSALARLASRPPTGASWWEAGLILLCFPVIAVSQWIFAYRDVGVGVVIALVLVLTISLTLAVLPLATHVVRALDSLLIVPIYVLFTSSLPWFFVDSRLLLPAVYSVVLALVAWRLQRLPLTLSRLRQLGFVKRDVIRYTLLGAVIAIPAGIIEYVVLRPSAPAPDFDPLILLKDTVYMLFFVSLAEELLFRSLIQRDLSAVFGTWPGLVLASVLFGVMHMTWRDPVEILFTSFAGLVLGYLYIRTRSLTASLSMHAVNNIVLVSVMPYVLGW